MLYFCVVYFCHSFILFTNMVGLAGFEPTAKDFLIAYIGPLGLEPRKSTYEVPSITFYLWANISYLNIKDTLFISLPVLAIGPKLVL